MKGLTIGGKHTYRDFELKMLSFSVSSPEIYEEYQEVPGRHGKLDLSDFLTGEPVYKERKLDAVFDFEEPDPCVAKQKMSRIKNCMHGRTFKIIDDDDQDWFFEGRLQILTERKNNRFYNVSISSTNLYPFKRKNEKTTVTVILSNEEQNVILSNNRESVVPEITCTGESTVIFNEITYALSAGTHILPDVLLKEGDNQVIVTGEGTVTFVYQEGAL